MSQKFLSLSFAPSGSKMNETFPEQASNTSSWNFETKFLPVLSMKSWSFFDTSFIILLSWAQCEQRIQKLSGGQI